MQRAPIFSGAYCKHVPGDVVTLSCFLIKRFGR